MCCGMERLFENLGKSLELLAGKKSSFDAIINHRQNYGYRRIDLLVALDIRVIDTGL
jgi:hypothetical protein